jgi:hypothetical protein
LGIGKSFTLGHKAEQLIIAILNQNGFTARKNSEFDKRYDYDIVFDFGKRVYKVEVKYDKMSNKTGNIAIEFFNAKKGEASGISVTCADLWAQVLSPTELFITSVTRLRGYTEKTKPKRVIYAGGDDNSDMMLFDKDDILSVFFNIHDLNKAQLTKVLKKLL